MANKSLDVDGENRVSLTIHTFVSVMGAVIVCVATAAGLYYKIDNRLSKFEDTVNGGLVSYSDHEKWVLKARAANAVKYPDLVWPSISDSKITNVNAPMPVAFAIAP